MNSKEEVLKKHIKSDALKDGKSSEEFEKDWEDGNKDMPEMIPIITAAMDEWAEIYANRKLGELVGWMEERYNSYIRLMQDTNDESVEYRYLDAFTDGLNLCIQKAKSLLKQEGVPHSKRVYKYFIEDKITGKWLCIGEMFDTRRIKECEDSRWTSDPQYAIQWDSFQEAEEHNKKYFNMPSIEVTEHEFVNICTCAKTVECCDMCSILKQEGEAPHKKEG